MANTRVHVRAEVIFSVTSAMDVGCCRYPFIVLSPRCQSNSFGGERLKYDVTGSNRTIARIFFAGADVADALTTTLLFASRAQHSLVSGLEDFTFCLKGAHTDIVPSTPLLKNSPRFGLHGIYMKAVAGAMIAERSGPSTH